ncbi:hypothetical protein, partial [Spirochaeta dissipatitropha]
AGAILGLYGGPAGVAIGTTVGSISGAIIAAMKGAAGGGLLGAATGKVMDDNIFDKFKCNDCSHTFSD